MDILLHAITALAYAGLALHFWNSRWRARNPPPLSGGERLAILVPLGLHSGLIIEALLFATQPRFGFAIALSTMLWIAVLIYWVESAFMKLEGMQAPVLALAALCVPWPAIFPGMMLPPLAHSIEFRAHAALAMLAYSLFTIAALHVLLMTLLERRLHGRAASVGGLWAAMPPLMSMESLLFRLIWIGFLLLTLTLASGAIYSETIFGQALKFNHKTLFAVISWLIFAALLAGRHFRGWRGRVALRWTLAGFVTLLLAYVGSRFVLEVVLKRFPA